jgi:hypothetical protein
MKKTSVRKRIKRKPRKKVWPHVKNFALVLNDVVRLAESAGSGSAPVDKSAP